MKLEDIQELWAKDARIDTMNLANAAAQVPILHSRYWKLLIAERIKLRVLEQELNCLKNDKFWFFLQGHDEETRAKGWELPARGKVFAKEEARLLVDSEQDVVEKSLKVAAMREKCLFLEDIIKSINGRSFTIKNIIEWKKFENGS